MRSPFEKEKGQRNSPEHVASLKKTQSSDESAKKLYGGPSKATGGYSCSNRRPTPSKRKQSEKGIAVYERRKAAWLSDHPDATSLAYGAAMTRLARECGV